MKAGYRIHTVVEEGAVANALAQLRTVVGPDGFTIAELVVLGAERRLLDHEAEEARRRRLLDALSDGIRYGTPPAADVEVADEVRRSGWVRRL